jgi:ribosomal protein L2
MPSVEVTLPFGGGEKNTQQQGQQQIPYGMTNKGPATAKTKYGRSAAPLTLR